MLSEPCRSTVGVACEVIHAGTLRSLTTEFPVPVLSRCVSKKLSFQVRPDRRGEAKSLIYQGRQVALLTVYDICKAVDCLAARLASG